MPMVRTATPDDLEACVAMGARFRDGTPYAEELTHNPEQFRAIGTFLLREPTGLLLVSEDAGHVMGMLGAAVSDHMLSGQRTASELFWWVEPAHRGSAGVRLLQAFEQWAREHDAAWITMVQPSWAPRVGDLYEKLGYHAIEVAWSKQATRP